MTKPVASLLGGRELKVVRELGARAVPTFAAHWTIGTTLSSRPPSSEATGLVIARG
ncbi:MAG: hypothetical protein NVS3B10_25930 [Polyangiales bacterium]